MLSIKTGRYILRDWNIINATKGPISRFYSSKPPKIEGEATKEVTTGANKRRVAPFSKKITKSRIQIKKKEGSVMASEGSKSNSGVKEAVKNKDRDQKERQTQGFISFDKFPKIPENVKNQSIEELYTSLNMRPWIKTLPLKEKSEEEVIQGSKNFVDFSIPEKYIKSTASKEITEKDRALVQELDNFLKSEDESDISQSQLNLIKLYYDQDTNSFQPIPEHSLKKSLSGMINLNPALNDIDDEYLWKIIPHNKQFGSPPYEDYPNTTFSRWERKMAEKKKEDDVAKEKDNEEVKQFLDRFNKQKSFFTKSSKGGRKKLDRELLRMYKKLKNDGKLPKELDYIDENKLF